jgi:hypothetical protein
MCALCCNTAQGDVFEDFRVAFDAPQRRLFTSLFLGLGLPCLASCALAGAVYAATGTRLDRLQQYVCVCACV